jgi:hypothetical protein
VVGSVMGFSLTLSARFSYLDSYRPFRCCLCCCFYGVQIASSSPGTAQTQTVFCHSYTGTIFWYLRITIKFAFLFSSSRYPIASYTLHSGCNRCYFLNLTKFFLRASMCYKFVKSILLLASRLSNEYIMQPNSYVFPC